MPPRRAAEELARSREDVGGDDEHRAIDDLRAQDDDGPSRRVGRRELLARLRRAAKSGSSGGAGVGGGGVPLHTMLLAICAAGEVRKEMLFALAQRPRDVGTLARDMDLDQPRVSQHLSQLRKAGLVSSLCEGGRKVYSVGAGGETRNASPRRVWVSRESVDSGVSRIYLTGSNGFSCVLIDDYGTFENTGTDRVAQQVWGSGAVGGRCPVPPRGPADVRARGPRPDGPGVAAQAWTAGPVRCGTTPGQVVRARRGDHGPRGLDRCVEEAGAPGARAGSSRMRSRSGGVCSDSVPSSQRMRTASRSPVPGLMVQETMRPRAESPAAAWPGSPARRTTRPMTMSSIWSSGRPGRSRG
ncbi:MAG: winged helix-turn-helix transcriptional regulator [Phycisphaeraceae bacterium]|nr:winged helix-turn-helix transcriptional regulator [Phycisphaeraceae bacterium]